MYLQGRISRLAGHPVANFVCTRVVERANQEQTELFISEVGAALAGCIENSRTGVLQALLEKSLQHGTKMEELSKVGKLSVEGTVELSLCARVAANQRLSNQVRK